VIKTLITMIMKTTNEKAKRGYTDDLLIENRVIVELKSLEDPFPKVFESQVISYLKASGLRVGLLVNFGNEKCVVRRLVIS